MSSLSLDQMEKATEEDAIAAKAMFAEVHSIIQTTETSI